MESPDYSSMAEAARRHHRQRRAYLFTKFSRHKIAVASILYILTMTVFATFSPWIAPYPEDGQGVVNVDERLKAPSWENLMGTDIYGRDVFSRIVYGARVSIFGSFIVIASAVLIGVPLGLWAGYREGLLGQLIGRAVEIFMSFPAFLTAIGISVILGSGFLTAITAMMIFWWTGYARVVEGEVLSAKHNLYITSARMLGYTDRYIIFHHLLPNIIAPVLVIMVMDFGTAIITLGVLSWLGLGTQAPVADWGMMIFEGTGNILTEWWIVVFPGLALTLLVVSFNMFGSTFQQLVDPRRRH